MPQAMTRNTRKKIGEALVEAGLIGEVQLRSALADQKRWGNRLGKTLVKLGFVEEAPLMRQLSRLMGYPLAEIRGREIDGEVLALVPPDQAEKARCIPLFVDDDGASRYLYLGMEEPADADALEALQLRIGLEICPVLIGFSELDASLRRYYGVGLDGDAVFQADPEGFEIGGGPVGSDCLRHGDEALTGDAEPEAAQRSAPAAAAEASPAAEDAGRVGETSTRRILQALTHVLVEKGMLTRAELIHQIQELAKTDDA